MSARKVLVVLTVLEGRNLSYSQDASLVVDGVIDGHVLSTDPIPQCASTLRIQNELAWEMDHKTLQEHKLHHTPIKLQIFSVDNATSTRKLIGYIMLDLRTAKPLSKVVPQWHKVLNVRGQGPSPELSISVGVEENIKNGDSSSHAVLQCTDVDAALVLHPSGEYYCLGSPSAQKQLLVISITLDNPSCLPKGFNRFYYSYIFVDVEVTSEEFTLSDFKPERASVRIMGVIEGLEKVLSVQPNMKISLCQGGTVLGEGSMSLEHLVSKDSLKSKVKFNMDDGSASFIDVTVLVRKEDSPITPDKGNSEWRFSVKRSLARSFQEVSDVSVPKESHSELVHGIPDIMPLEGPSVIMGLHHPDSTANTYFILEEKSSETAEYPPAEESNAITNIGSDAEDCTSKSNKDRSPSKSSADTATAVMSKHASAPVSIHVGTQAPSSAQPSPCTVPNSDFCGGCREAGSATHLYHFSIEVFSIHNISLREGLKRYVKYIYPFFGCQIPVLVQPAVSLVPGVEHHFSASPSSFKFACSEMSLKTQLHCHPLSLEVWTSQEESDNLAGVAKVPLSEVFRNEKVSLGGNIYQRCSLKVPAFSPMLSQITCAFICCTLTLEDQGPPPLEKKAVPVQSEGLPSSFEYFAATELEMWKLCQEEAFTEKMRNKEATYLFQLQEEWKRREDERQSVFTQKVDAYGNMETQLRIMLETVQSEQKKLSKREAELQQLRNELLLKEQSLSKSSEANLLQCRLSYEGKLDAQRARAEELLETVQRLKTQVSELSRKLASRDAEFDGYRQQVLSKPESKLQAELTLVHMEKTELEKKLSSALKAKQYYKEQWSQAMKDLAAHRQREQEVAQTMLRTQQKELESIRERQVNHEEQRMICEQLTQVKEEVDRLQRGILKGEREKFPLLKPSSSDADTSFHPDVARWIEERDILLQTGVYTHSDLTIQNLEKKIKAVLN